jgi:spore coat protein JB
MMKREELLMLLTEIDFTALDLQLFLNTHPDDMKAIEQYNAAVAKSKSLREEYEKAYGPLMSFRSPSRENCFSWIDSPWPWQRDFM